MANSNFPVAENPKFAETMEQITTKDRAAPETFNPKYQRLLDNDNFLKKEFERARNSVCVVLAAEKWTEEAPFRLEVHIPGMKETDNPTLYPHTSKELSVDEIKRNRKLAGYITDGEAMNGYVVFYCGIKRPEEDFTVLLVGIGKAQEGSFEGASYSNMEFSNAPPVAGENWAQLPGADVLAVRAAGDIGIIDGKLAVSEEPSSDAAFFAELN